MGAMFRLRVLMKKKLGVNKTHISANDKYMFLKYFITNDEVFIMF